MVSHLTPRADLYHTLAEALAEPPEWLALTGREWPLFEAAVRLPPPPAPPPFHKVRGTGEGSLVQSAIEKLAEIGAESLALRHRRYAALFGGPGRPRYWLYESAARSGRLLGAETIAVEQWYRAAGLDVTGAELPDHASLELAFLALLAERQAIEVGQAGEWLKLERSFIKQHAGRWLPELGRALSRSGDAVYAPIGLLLAGWLEEASGKGGRMMPIKNIGDEGRNIFILHPSSFRSCP